MLIILAIIRLSGREYNTFREVRPGSAQKKRRSWIGTPKAIYIARTLDTGVRTADKQAYEIGAPISVRIVDTP